MVNTDPLNLRRFGESQYKTLSILLLISLVSGLLFLIVFFIGFFSGGGSSSSGSSISNWNENETGKYLSAMALKVKIMPSQGHGVQEIMNWTNAETLQTSGSTKQSSDYRPSYHSYTKDTSMKFATFIFNDEMVPVGDAQEKCVYFEVAAASDKSNPYAYKPLEEMPDCLRAKNGWWNQHDPVIGINIPTWYQNEIYYDCSGKSCSDTCTKKKGWWVFKNDKTTGVCYTYTVLTQICVKIGMYKDTFGKVHWKYTGGCFKNNDPGRYEDAKPGNTYRFELVPIIVRADNDPQLGQGGSEKGGSGFSVLSLLLLIISVGSGVGFFLSYKKASSSGEYQNSL